MEFVKEHHFPGFDGGKDIELREYSSGKLLGSVYWNGTLSIQELGNKMMALEQAIIRLGFTNTSIYLDPYDGLFEITAQKVKVTKPSDITDIVGDAYEWSESSKSKVLAAVNDLIKQGMCEDVAQELVASVFLAACDEFGA